MSSPDPIGVTAADLEGFLASDYASKDTMHDLTHIRRVHRAAEHLAAVTRTVYNRDVLLIGAYLHGVVYTAARELAARHFLATSGVAATIVERAVTAAWESQTDATPASAEGILLHDGHLLEGGRSFLLVKTLVTGGARGSSLPDIAAFWQRHVAGRFRCVLPAAQAEYEDQESFAQAVFEELARNPGLESVAPAA